MMRADEVPPDSLGPQVTSSNTDEAWRAKDEQLVSEALRAAEISVASPYDLLHSRLEKRAVQPLLDVLPKVTHPRIKEGVVRALTDTAARGIAARPLIRELQTAAEREDGSYGWVVGNALAVVGDDTVLDDLLRFAVDDRLGLGRQTVIEALGRFGSHDRYDEIVVLLIENLQDDLVTGQAISALRKLGARKAARAIAPFEEHPKAWIRREAKKALRRLA